MPLPDPATQGALDWPPRELARVTPKLQEWSAWYGGDANALARQYGAFGGGGARLTAAPSVRASQYAGGVVGAVARFFWGAPAAPGQQLIKLHMPVAADIATASADLLFAESPTIKVPEEIAKARPTVPDRLTAVLDGLLWEALLVEQAEVNAALGGVYLRGHWDREVEPDHPLATAVHADAAVPEFRYGRLWAVTFWSVLANDGTRVLRYLERHEMIGGAGRIEYGLYEGTNDKLGRRVDFGADPATLARLKDVVDDTSSQATKLPFLDTVYVPNMRPNKLWRSEPLASSLGRSDYDGIEGMMDAVDETLTSWMRDIRIGKGRVIVPRYMLEAGNRGAPSMFNIDQEVFVGLELPPSDDPGSASREITVQQFTIRSAEHADTLKGLLTAAFRGAGYSAQTFGLPDEAATTATEINSRDRRSDVTREKKSRYYTDALKRFLRVLIGLDTVQFAGGMGLDWTPQVVFPPSSRPAEETEARSVQMWRAAEAMSTDAAVRRRMPDATEDEVAEEVARILDERKAAQSVPDPFPGPGADQLPPDDGQEPAADGGPNPQG